MKYIILLLFIISMPLFSQDNIINLNPDNDTITISESLGNYIIDINKTYVSSSGNTSLLIWFDSEDVTKSELTYNSTGDTIVSVLDNIVLIDDYDDATVGNSIRFGNPTSGTIYTILSIDVDELTLDQTCTGDIGDEFYVGCDGNIIDKSIYGNNGVQSIGAYQPKGIWIETDSSFWLADGVDDYIESGVDTDGLQKMTVSIWVRSVNVGIIISKYENNSNRWHIYASNNLVWNIGGLTYGYNTFSRSDIWYHYVMVFDGTGATNSDRLKVYIDNEEKTLTFVGTIPSLISTIPNDLTLANQGSSLYLNCKFDDLQIYKKVLTTDEIEQLYINSKHYTP